MIDTAIILAAGRGSRLKEVTANRSKAMAPIAGKPIIGRVIEALAEAGVLQYIIVGAPHDEELRRYCASIPKANFVVQEKPVGSGDALMSAKHLAPKTFLVCACDSLIPAQDIKRLINSHSPQAVATLSLLEVAPDCPLGSRSVVTLSGDRVTNFIEKPKETERLSNLSSLPLYILSDEVFTQLSRIAPSPRGEYELPEAFRAFIKEGRLVRGIHASNRFDLTDQNDLLALNERFLATLSPAIQAHPSIHVPSSVTLRPPVLIDEGVSLGENSSIGPFVYLECGAVVESGVSLDHVVVTRGARVTSAASKRVLT